MQEGESGNGSTSVLTNLLALCQAPLYCCKLRSVYSSIEGLGIRLQIYLFLRDNTGGYIQKIRTQCRTSGHSGATGGYMLPVIAARREP